MSVEEETRTLRGSLLGFSVEAKKKENTGQKDPNLSGTVGLLRQTRVLLKTRKQPSWPRTQPRHVQHRIKRNTSMALL